MPGEGFMQSMRISLKNNRNLLNGRKRGFFKRELTYADIRKYYKESTDPISKEKGSNTIELREIRERLQKRQRRFAYLQGGLFLLVAFLIGYGSFVFLTKPSVPYQKATFQSLEVSKDERKNAFEESMSRGNESLKNRQYFLAVGNYQKALKHQPHNIQAELSLAKAYAKACKDQSLFCAEAAEFIDQIQEERSDKKQFDQLKQVYLTVNTE